MKKKRKSAVRNVLGDAAESKIRIEEICMRLSDGADVNELIILIALQLTYSRVRMSLLILTQKFSFISKFYSTDTKGTLMNFNSITIEF